MIEAYQRIREAESKEFEKVIKEHFPERIITKDDIDKTHLLLEQHDIPDIEKEIKKGAFKKEKEREAKPEVFKKDITKYRLWLKEGGRCVYTGKNIKMDTLFTVNNVDFEHTIPRSMSFDNSMSNLTVCDARFNRNDKMNRIPSQLLNYGEILQRIQPWVEKVEKLKGNVSFWGEQAKRAQDKPRKDYCMRQKHLWRMEWDYWQKKVDAFTRTEVTSGFRNSQLNDTRIITKYAYHYLRSLFNRVEVQKGQYMSDFRKMLGIQGIYKKKNRDKHVHHAIDAAILTLIPVAAKRGRMMELFYKIEEGKRLGNDISMLIWQLDKERKECGFKNAAGIDEFIENNIIVNHISKDNALTPAKRKGSRQGKEIWIKGDSIRDNCMAKLIMARSIRLKKIRMEKLSGMTRGRCVLMNRCVIMSSGRN